MKNYGMGNFNKDIEKMIDELATKANKHNLGEYIESQEDAFEDDPITEVIRYIAFYYDVM